MFERLTNNARAWRIGSTLFVFTVMTLINLAWGEMTRWESIGGGVVLGIVQFVMAPYYRRLAQERLAARRGIPPAA